MRVEKEQEAALKLMAERHTAGTPEVTQQEITEKTGCIGIAMGDLLAKGYVEPVRGVTSWKIALMGLDFADNYL